MPSQITSSFVNSYLRDCLKGKGFTRFQNVWNREIGNFIHVVEIQDRLGAADHCAMFTVNLGVFVPIVLSVVWDKPKPRRVTELDCTITERIGRLMPDGLDKWWRLDPSVNEKDVANEVSGAIQMYSDQFFKGVSDLDGLKSRMIGQGDEANPYGLRRIYLAVVESLLGNIEHSFGLLDSLKLDKVWGEKSEKVKKRLSLHANEAAWRDDVGKRET